LSVDRGQRVEAGASLFVLDRAAETAAQRQADALLRMAEARWEDLKKGARDSELAALAARIEQARSTAELARLDFERVDHLHRTSVVAESEFDRTRLSFERAKQALEQLEAEATTARLGGRPDAIIAAEADAASARAALEKANWSVAEKSQAAPRAALVYDVIYRTGEFVPAGSPVVALLAPDLLRVRFFVPEREFAELKAGAEVQVAITGQPAVTARVTYLSPRPEYTPPVLYNRENRAKLVFMVEATFTPHDSLDLHPGQPVDVTPN
jgi:HlyD family secretion protein